MPVYEIALPSGRKYTISSPKPLDDDELAAAADRVRFADEGNIVDRPAQRRPAQASPSPKPPATQRRGSVPPARQKRPTVEADAAEARVAGTLGETLGRMTSNPLEGIAQRSGRIAQEASQDAKRQNRPRMRKPEETFMGLHLGKPTRPEIRVPTAAEKARRISPEDAKARDLADLTPKQVLDLMARLGPDEFVRLPGGATVQGKDVSAEAKRRSMRLVSGSVGRVPGIGGFLEAAVEQANPLSWKARADADDPSWLVDLAFFTPGVSDVAGRIISGAVKPVAGAVARKVAKAIAERNGAKVRAALAEARARGVDLEPDFGSAVARFNEAEEAKPVEGFLRRARRGAEAPGEAGATPIDEYLGRDVGAKGQSATGREAGSTPAASTKAAGPTAPRPAMVRIALTADDADWVREAHRGLDVEEGADGGLSIVHRDGRRVRVEATPGIEIDPMQFERDYGRKPTAEDVALGEYRIVGDGGQIGEVGVIALSKAEGAVASRVDVLHESLHEARALGLIDSRAWASALRTYGSEEGIAAAYAAYEPGSKPGSWMERVYRFFSNLYERVVKPHKARTRGMFEGLRSGKTWDGRPGTADDAARLVDEAKGETRYSVRNPADDARREIRDLERGLPGIRNLPAEVREAAEEYAADHGVERQGRMSVDEYRQTLEAMGMPSDDAVKLAKKGQKSGTQVVYLGHAYNSLDEALQKAYNDLAQGKATLNPRVPDDAKRLADLEAQTQLLERQIVEVMRGFTHGSSELGRALRMHQELSRNLVDLSGLIRTAEKVRGRDLSPSETLQLKTAFEAFDAAAKIAKGKPPGSAEVEALAQARRALDKTMRRFYADGWVDTLIAVRRAGLLTGLRTQARNVTGNTLGAAFDEVARIPGSLLDIALSLGTKRRTYSGLVPGDIAKSISESVRKGTKEFLSVMRNGAGTEDLAKYDIGGELNFKGLGKASPVVNAYVNYIQRLQSGSDKWARVYAFRRSILEQARFLSNGDKAAEKAILAKPDEAMLLRAAADSEMAVFANPNKLAGVAQTARKIPYGGKLFEMAVPFVTTPTNVAGRLAESNAVGGTVKLISLAKLARAGGLTPEIQLEMSRTFGRATAGTGLIVLGYKLAEKGIVRGAGSLQDKAKRDTDEALGESPGSIRVGDTQHRLQDSPQGNLLAIGASLYEAGRDGKSQSVAGVKAAGKLMLDVPMIQGVSDAVRAASDPERESRRWLTGFVGSWVPTWLADVAVHRDTGFKRKPENVPQALKARVPGKRGEVPMVYDALGYPVPDRPAYHPLGALYASKPRQGPVYDAIRKYNLQLTKPARVKDEKRIDWDATDADYQERVRLVGEAARRAIEETIADPEWQRLPLEERTQGLIDMVRLAKAAATRDIRARREDERASKT